MQARLRRMQAGRQRPLGHLRTPTRLAQASTALRYTQVRATQQKNTCVRALFYMCARTSLRNGTELLHRARVSAVRDLEGRLRLAAAGKRTRQMVCGGNRVCNGVHHLYRCTNRLAVLSAGQNGRNAPWRLLRASLGSQNPEAQAAAACANLWRCR